MVSEKVRKKQLKAPDEFQKKAYKFVDLCAKNKNLLLAVATISSLAIIGAFAWHYIENQQSSSRRQELGQYDLSFSKENNKIDEVRVKLQGEIDNINQSLAKLEEKKKTKNTEKTEKTEKTDKKVDKAELESKKQALEKQISDLKPDHKGVMEEYLKFFEKHSSSPEGRRAAVSAISILIQEEDFARASEIAQKVTSQAKNSHFYGFQLRNLYISLLEQQKKFPEALEAAKTLIQEASDENIASALLTQGRIELLSGNKKAAFITLGKVVNEHNSSKEAEKAKALMAIW